MIQAVLSNAAHPEYGAATIPFPIPRDEYDDCIASLKVLEIGSASKRDCKVDEICGAWPVLKRLEGTPVNLDERTIWPNGWTALMSERPRNFRPWRKSWISTA